MHKLRIVRLIITWKMLLEKIVFYLEFSIVHRPLKIGISISEKYQKNVLVDFFFPIILQQNQRRKNLNLNDEENV